MDQMFTSLAIQTVTLVGKAAFGAAGTIALKKFTQFIRDVPTHQTKELEYLRMELEMRLKLVVPAIDLIDILAARGNSTLTAVIPLTTQLRRQTEEFSEHLEQFEDQWASNFYDHGLAQSDQLRTSKKLAGQMEKDIQAIQTKIQQLMNRITEMVPFLNLALTTSGAHLGASLPSSISPGRVLQASACLHRAHQLHCRTAMDAQLSTPNSKTPMQPQSCGDSEQSDHDSECFETGDPSRTSRSLQATPPSESPPSFCSLNPLGGSIADNLARSLHELVTEVKPHFRLTMYSLFTSSVRHKSRDDFTWKEEFPKCRAYLQRVRSTSLPYFYEFVVVQDLNDGRYHDDVSPPRSVPTNRFRPGAKRIYPVTDIIRLHYSSSGQLLNIEDSKQPVLVIQVQIPTAHTTNTMATTTAPMSRSGTLASSLASLTIHDRPKLAQEADSSAGRLLDSDSTHEASDNAAPTDSEGPSTPTRLLASAASYALPVPQPHFEWIAFQVFQEDESEDDDQANCSEAEEACHQVPPARSTCRSSVRPATAAARPNSEDDSDNASLKDEEAPTTRLSNASSGMYFPLGQPVDGNGDGSGTPVLDSTLPFEQLSLHNQLSLLEYLLRLAALEMCEQASHFNVPDEKLALFLRDDNDALDSSSGAGSHSHHPSGPLHADSRQTATSIVGSGVGAENGNCLRMNSSGNIAFDIEQSVRKSFNRGGTPKRPDYGSPLSRRRPSPWIDMSSASSQNSPLRRK
ncbi:Ran-specific GTPase-activating protein 30 [Dimargaris verticillata]|uniref:Ran-specific GTPase-activating protein 30 n=1 Tax=Dimargaris verticillata TaxID=2761393 RepID=A0A9W8EDV7_9FUNG|nr:Ran-specific GTPase-activating protein 30 [Dimargaris verticillata]